MFLLSSLSIGLILTYTKREVFPSDTFFSIAREPSFRNVCEMEYYVVELDYVVSIVMKADEIRKVNEVFNIFYGSLCTDTVVSLTGMNGVRCR